MQCVCGYLSTESVAFCGRCGRNLEGSSQQSAEKSLVAIKTYPVSPSKESLREVKAEARRRQQLQRRNNSFARKRRLRYSLRRVRLGLGGLLALVTGAMLVGSGFLPWTHATLGTFKMNIGAADLYDWLPIYAIAMGLLIIGATVQGSDSAKSLVGSSALITVGITAYVWSQLSSLLNLISGFGGLFSNGLSHVQLSKYLHVEVGLALWAGSVIIGIISYFAMD
jgi:hypothetical protein